MSVPLGTHLTIIHSFKHLSTHAHIGLILQNIRDAKAQIHASRSSIAIQRWPRGRILKGVTGSKPLSLTESMIIYRLYKIENVQNYINFPLNSPEYSIFSMSIPSGVRRR